jgi:hypothetical protein
VLLDDPADAQVSQLGHNASAGAAAHQHVARILRQWRQWVTLNGMQALAGAQIKRCISRTVYIQT